MGYHYIVQYIPRNMHTVFALLCFVVVIHWLIFPYPSGLLHWHCGNLTIAPVPAKQPWWIWINTSCEFIMNDCITTTKQNTTKPCAYFLGYTVTSTRSTSPKSFVRHDWIYWVSMGTGCDCLVAVIFPCNTSKIILTSWHWGSFSITVPLWGESTDPPTKGQQRVTLE